MSTVEAVTSHIESTREKKASFDVQVLDNLVPQDPSNGKIRFKARYGSILIAKASTNATEIERLNATTARIHIRKADTEALSNRLRVFDYEVTWEPNSEAGEEYVIVEGRWAIYPSIE
jgi:hypothetical protein